MQDKINIIKKIIIVFIVIILIMAILLVLLINKKGSNKNKDNVSIKENINFATESINEQIEDEVIIEDKNIIDTEGNNIEKPIRRIKDYKTFYTIQNCIVKFESYVNLDYTKKVNELGYPSLASEYGIYSEEEKNKAILDFLDKDFIKSNNITINNLSRYINISILETNVDVLAVNKLIDVDTSVKAYSVYAKKTRNNNSEYVYYIAKLINENVFCIYPIEKGHYFNIDEITIENNTKFIEKNDRNGYVKSTINDGEIITKYFQEYKELMLKNPEEAYIKLDKEYREKRFGTIEDFKEYLNSNGENIRLMQVYRYNIKEYSEYNEYTVQDRFENLYLFYEIAPKEYSVMLDSYTIPTEEYKEKYNAASEEVKCIECVKKFINMINSKDYKNAYRLLNSIFKINNFNNIEEFKYMINQNLYNINYIVETNIDEYEDYYIVNVEIGDRNNTNNTKKVNFIIKLIDNNNFEMSFSFE